MAARIVLISTPLTRQSTLARIRKMGVDIGHPIFKKQTYKILGYPIVCPNPPKEEINHAR